MPPFDFRAWLNVSPSEKPSVEDAVRSIAEEPATAESAKEKQQRINQAWAEFCYAVSQRFHHENYQKIVTYALLANASPQLIAKMVKEYVMTGKTPWQS